MGGVDGEGGSLGVRQGRREADKHLNTPMSFNSGAEFETMAGWAWRERRKKKKKKKKKKGFAE